MARVALLVTLLLLLAACPSREADEVRIGLLVSRSGPHATFGVDVERGARLAVRDLNEAGGVLGRPVELVVRDASDPAAVPRQIADLVGRDRVTAVIGPEAPGVVLSDRSPLASPDVPAILPTATSGNLAEAPATVVRVAPSARDQAAAIARWLTQERQVTEIAVLVADPIEGDAAQESLVAGLETAALDVSVLAVDGDAPDLGPAVSRLRRQAPQAEALLVWGPPTPTARATRATRALGWEVQIVVPSTSFAGTFRSLAGDASEGVVLPFPFREEWFGPPLDEWLARWHRMHGLDVLAGLETLVLDLPVAGIAAYDAVGMVATAVAEAGSTEPSRVAAALVENDFEGLLRTYAPRDGESWTTADLHIARFHNYAIVYDVDPDLDPAWQRRFYDAQVHLDFIPPSILEGPGGDVIADLLEQRRATAPPYRPPSPPPGPVAAPPED